MARFFNNQKEIDEYTDALIAHVSKFNKQIEFINKQRPEYYRKDYKNGLWMNAEDNEGLLGYELDGWKITDRNVIECFVVGC